MPRTRADVTIKPKHSEYILDKRIKRHQNFDRHYEKSSSRSPPRIHGSMEVKLGHVSRVTGGTCLSPHTNENIVHESIKVEINHGMMMMVWNLVVMFSQQSLLRFPSLTSVDHLNELRSFHFLPHVEMLPRFHLRRCETRMRSFQVSLQLRVSPRELTLVHRTAPRFCIHEPPCAS